MSSLGETHLSIGSRIAGMFRVLHLTEDRSLHPRLGLCVGCRLTEIVDDEAPHQTLKDFELLSLTGEVRMGEHGPTVGTLIWVGERTRVGSTKYPNESQLQMVCDLDPWRLEAIEKARAGQELTLWIVLWPQLLMQGALLRGTVHPIRAEVPRGKWMAFLRNVRYGTYDVLEIHTPQFLEGIFKKALEHLREARKQLDLGHYNDAVGAARKAIEAIAVDEGVAPKQADLEKLLSLTMPPNRAEALSRIAAHVKHLSALGMHETNQPDFTRAEALFVLRICQELCILFGEQLARRQTIAPTTVG